MNNNKLLKNTLIYTIGNLGSKILSFLLVPLYSFYLVKIEMGIYDIIITTISLLVPIISIQLSDGVYRWLLDSKDEMGKVKAITNSALILLLSSTCFTAIILIVYSIFNIEYKWYFLLLLYSSFLLPFFQQILRGLGKIKNYAAIGILNTLLTLCLNILFLTIFKLGINGILLSSIFAGFVCILVIIFQINFPRYLKLSYLSKDIYLEIFRYCWPLIPNTLSWWLINAADKYVIFYILGESANGIFAVSSRFPAIITILNSIFMLAWQDVALTDKDNAITQDYLERLFKHFYIFEFSILFVLIASSKFLISNLISSAYFDSWNYMPLLYIGTVFAAFSSFVGVSYLKVKKTKMIFNTSILGGIINIIISFTLIKIIGLYASALGTLVGFLLMFIIRVKFIRKHETLRINYKYFISLFLLSVVFMFLVRINNPVFEVLLFLFSLIIFYFMNKQVLHKIFNVAINKVIRK